MDENRLVATLTDSETGLLNATYFNLRLEEEFKKSWRFSWSYALLFLEVEGLAAHEKISGRNAGDAAVLDIAGEILTASRDVDLSARISRSRFAMLLPGTPAAGALVMVQRVMSQVLEKLDAGLSLSVGISAAPQDGLSSVEDFLSRADAALQLARSQGRNQVVTWNSKSR
ncbi:MAG TPA: GGDEF domain-containing protein [Planctomycetota bacterium]|nr:GGDEF domain-containing protein [Planctomycetota bacterium]